MKRREFIELGIALVIVGGTAIVARFGEGYEFRCPRVPLNFRPSIGPNPAVATPRASPSSRIRVQAPCPTCGMGRIGKDSSAFIDEITRQRRGS